MSRSLRVLMVPGWFPSPENPVAGLFMLDLACAVSTKHTVTIVAPQSAAAPRNQIVDGIRTIRLPASRFRGSLATLARLRALSSITARLRTVGEPPDIIHAHTLATGPLAVIVGRRWGVPVVITENYSALLIGGLNAWDTRVARFTYRHADLVLPVSPLVQECLEQIQPRGTYKVVPDVVDVDAFGDRRRHSPRSPGTKIVAVAMLVRRKGLHDLVEAIRILVSGGRPVELAIVGEGPERSALESQAQGLPVMFLGPLRREEVVSVVCDADVFAMPTLADPFGISAVEALAASIPVVVTDRSGTSELIARHGGFVVPASDPFALAAALASALDHPSVFEPGTAEELRRYCGPDAVADQLSSIYLGLSRTD